ncbi:MAG: tetratricopeptide repeat protein [Acidobacteriota bacterium]
MRRPMAGLAVLLVLLSGCGYQGPTEEPVPREVKRAGEELPDQATLAEVRDYLEWAFQLPPDRRFLLAVTEMARLALGASQADTTAVWQDNGWAIRYGETPVGSLPAWPVFEDYWHLLRSWAQQLQPRLAPQLKNDNGKKEALKPALNFLEQAKELANRWQQGPSAKTLADAAQLATVLAAHHLDLLETGDEVSAHALALVALAEAFGQELPQERAVLAFRLGYWPGDELLGKLGPEHPLVLFVNHDSDKLQALAARSSDPLTVLFAAESLSESLLFSKAYDMAQRTKQVDPWSLVWLRAVGQRHEMPVAQEAGRQALVAAMAWAKGRKPPARERLPEVQLLRAFEKALASRSWPDNALFPRSWHQSFARSLFASGVEILVDYAVRQYAEVNAARQLRTALGNAKSPWGMALEKWAAAVVGSFLGEGDQQTLLRVLATPGAPGGQARMELFWKLERAMAFGVPERLAAARVAFLSLDSRPVHRQSLIVLARNTLLDLELAEKVTEELYRSSRLLFPLAVVYHKAVAGEQNLLWQWVNNPQSPPLVRHIALRYLGRLPDQPLPALEEAYEKLRDAIPDPWNLAEEMARVFVARGHPEKAVRILEDLCQGLSQGGLEYAVARAHLAQVLLKMGKNREGLTTVEEVVPSYQENVLFVYVRALLANGRKQEALEWAQKAYERYPFSEYSLVALMDVHWALGNYAAAAEAFARHRNTLSAERWRFDLGPVFVRRFHGKSQEAIEAMKAFGRKVEGEKLITLAHESARLGDVELAFVVAEKAVWPPGRPDLLFEAYRYLRQLKGKRAALEWLQERLKVEPWNRVSYECWDSESYEVLWDLLPPQPQGDGAERVWIQRAAALALGFDPGRKNRELVLSEFSKPSSDPNGALVRYLLGVATPKEEEMLLSTRFSRRDGGELAYYLGLKAQAEGRCSEAARWYRVAVERLPFVSYQYRWAYSRLYAWWSWDLPVAEACKHRGTRWIILQDTL